MLRAAFISWRFITCTLFIPREQKRISQQTHTEREMNILKSPTTRKAIEIQINLMILLFLLIEQKNYD